MSRQVHLFDRPARFIAGTVGQPGDRTFFLQASGAGRTVSVSLEKVQVSLLADRLEELLGEVQRRLGVPVTEGPPADDDNEPLDTPVDEEFRVGTLGLAFDVDTATVVIEAIAAGEVEPEVELGDEDDEEDDEDEEPDEDLDRLRVRLTPQATRQFIERARRVVNAGRPPCPLCGQPLDPAGHLCPRHNGYHR